MSNYGCHLKVNEEIVHVRFFFQSIPFTVGFRGVSMKYGFFMVILYMKIYIH